MSLLTVERDTEILVDNQLKNLGWVNDPHSAKRNVFQQRTKTELQKKKLAGDRPDYLLYPSGMDSPLAVIETKRRGENIHKALIQGIGYAKALDAPIVFATDGVFTKSLHVQTNKPLQLNGEEIDELIRETLALKYIASNDVSTLDKKVIKSRGELIAIFGKVNNLLREEGLQRGLERFSEFANILFLKVLSEIEDGKEEQGQCAEIETIYRWNNFRDKKGRELLTYVNEIVLKHFSEKYQDDKIFQPLQIRHPDNLKIIIDLLDGLQLTDINADIKGDAFEYFIRSYSASNPTDLGEIFTPRHIVKTMVKLLSPKIGEKIYDPFCGTGGMLIVAFKHLMDTMPRNSQNLETLRRSSVYGSELTRTASIAKMNMILAGDGHNNINRQDSLSKPRDNEYEIVLTNMPFSQKTRYGDLYAIPNRDGDIICPQHCFRALKDGGRMAMIVPEGFLTNTTPKAFSDVRRFLMERATLKSVISLPRGAFEPYNRAKADILYFTDAKVSRTKNHFWFFDVRNDGYTLDKKRRRIEGGNDLELVLSEKDLDKQTERYLLSIGVTRIEVAQVKEHDYILTGSHYRDSFKYLDLSYPVRKLGDILELASGERVGTETAPIMSITMAQGLIDQGDKFKKRIASLNISQYKKVYLNELVVGFPIDEGVLGFQLKYPFAAVSPAYNIWKLKAGVNDIDLRFFEMLLRSPAMREIYREKMQGAVDRRRSISKDVFLEIKVPIPPQPEQQLIVEMQLKIEKANHSIKTIQNDIANNLTRLWETKAERSKFKTTQELSRFDQMMGKISLIKPSKPKKTSKRKN